MRRNEAALSSVQKYGLRENQFAEFFQGEGTWQGGGVAPVTSGFFDPVLVASRKKEVTDDYGNAFSRGPYF